MSPVIYFVIGSIIGTVMMLIIKNYLHKETQK